MPLSVLKFRKIFQHILMYFRIKYIVTFYISHFLLLFIYYYLLLLPLLNVNYFQACTGIDDFGEAILYLEETNWDLLVNINIIT